MKPLGRLHLLTDTHLQNRFTHLQLAEMAFSFASPEIVVQFREKEFRAEIHGEKLEQICLLAKQTQQSLLINDHVDFAAKYHASGTHIGSEDMNPKEARNILGQEAILGLTVHNKQELEAANRCEDIDYIGVGPVFGTQSKSTSLPALGLLGLEQMVKNSLHRVIAIGSVQPENIPEILQTGAFGIAILSAWACAERPENVVRTCLDILSEINTAHQP